jgi:large subunit ribosomal protein L16
VQLIRRRLKQVSVQGIINEIVKIGEINMLAPTKMKYRKTQKGKMRGTACRGNEVSFGEFALQATECGKLTSRQIEAARIAMTRYIKRGGQIWIRIFPDKPITKKPLETRMGKGKGAPEEYICIIKPGRILYEIDGVDETIAREAFRLACHKLPISTQFLHKGEIR